VAAEAATANGEPKLTELSVEELQQLYTEVVGRDTGSSDEHYLVWKIREAKKRRIKTGPVRRRYADGEAPDMKVLPLRMEAEIVARLDEARERLGLKTRMDLFRRRPEPARARPPHPRSRPREAGRREPGADDAVAAVNTRLTRNELVPRPER